MKKKYHILFCVNEKSQILKTISFLKEKDYTIYIANTEVEFNKFLTENSIDLVVVELDFEFKDAISITNEIRNLKSIIQPNIIIFSNKHDDYIQITAFNAGADDYICTPIKPILLEARIEAFKKRRIDELFISDINSELNKKFYVDRDQYLVITEAGKISLPRKEFEMVDLMFQNSKKIFTRNDFANIIWHSNEVANSRTIDIHIRNIRKLLGNEIIRTSKGIGYSLNI
jgi:two-component system alkaline phosphatase synthesis response regulator PhoP